MNHDELKKACELVEKFARSIGPDFEIVFLGDSLGTEVQGACLSWGGSGTEEGLYECLMGSKMHAENVREG